MENFSDFRKDVKAIQGEIDRAIKRCEDEQLSVVFSNENGEPILVGQDPRDIDDVFETEIANMLSRLANHFSEAVGANSSEMEEIFCVDYTDAVAELREAVMNQLSDYSNLHFDYVTTEF